MKLRRIIKKFPFFERVIRKVYIYIKYIIHGDKKFTHSINKYVKITEIPFKNKNKSAKNNIKYFGYYDKSPWSKNGNYYLFHEINKNNQMSLKFVDIKNGGKVIDIGCTTTWNYQQGAMLQWVPNQHEDWLIYNNTKNNVLGCILFNIKNSKNIFLNWPVQSLNPNGKTATSINYVRLSKVNKEYSYKGSFSNFNERFDDQKDGLWSYNLFDNDSKLLISISDLINYRYIKSMKNAEHCVNHAIYSPTGNKILFIHRWLTEDNIRYSRLYVIDEESKEFKLIIDEEMVSHYCWINSNEILAYASKNYKNKYYKIDIKSGYIIEYGNDILNSYGDGHPGISPDGKWIVTDTYPDAARKRTLLLWNINDKILTEVGKFYSPLAFEYDKRCDLHPRWHPARPLISIDSAHEGIRSNYVLDVEKLTGKFL